MDDVGVCAASHDPHIMSVIDFHAHIVPQAYPARPAHIQEPLWPVMEPVSDRASRMVIAGKPFRVFESFYWDSAQRIEQMDQHGIHMEVLSPLPELLSYWLHADAAAALTDFMNGMIGDMVRSHPSRFQGMGAVALQDTAHAVRQLEGLRREHGLKGVHVGSHINGVSLADERFLPFFEAAEDLGLFVFVHGLKPGGGERMLGSPLMAPVLGVPHETTMTIGSLIMMDILGKFPRLNLVFAHGGGGIGAVLDRFDVVWNKFPVMRVNGDIPPREYARRFYYDTVTFGPDYLGYLIRALGADRFVAGTDGPTEIGQSDLPAFLDKAGLSDSERQAVMHDNAARLLGL